MSKQCDDVDALLAKLSAEHQDIDESFPKLFEALGFQYWHNRGKPECWPVQEALGNLEKAYRRQDSICDLKNRINTERAR